LNATEAVADEETLRTRFSIGQGNCAKVPWIAFLDARETDSTQRGVYPVYLFREDASGFYLVLGQGVTDPKRELGTAGAQVALAPTRQRSCASTAVLWLSTGSQSIRSGPWLARSRVDSFTSWCREPF
jgi:MrcB-like, N-terminal domain